MKLGLDFDNTIVNYDGLFHAAAVAGNLAPPDVGRSKTQVRDYLRENGREDQWTVLQGRVYGEQILDAPPFPGACRFLVEALRLGHQTHIVSHRTKRPAAGSDADMHEAARAWIARYLIDDKGQPLPIAAHFEETRDEKLARIAELGCDLFVDDLPEFLSEPKFPTEVRRVLFDPAGLHPALDGVQRIFSWNELAAICLRTHESSQ